MSLDRTNIVREPGLIQFASSSFYSQTPIVADLIGEPFTVESDMHGPIDERVSDRRIEIKFTPVGELESLAVLLPHGGLTMGASIFGSSDTACSIFTPSGQRLVVHNCAVTSMPNVIMSHNQTLFGEVTITGLLVNSGDPTDAAAYYTHTPSGVTYPGDAAFDPAAIKTFGYKGAWGSSPWDEFYTEAGFELTTDMSLDNEFADGHGTVDMKLNTLDASITGIPKGITSAQLLAGRTFQGTGNALGAKQSSGTDLVITNIGTLALHVQLYGAVLTETPITYSGKQGQGAVTWKPSREFTAGVADPLFYVGTTAPS